MFTTKYAFDFIYAINCIKKPVHNYDYYVLSITLSNVSKEPLKSWWEDVKSYYGKRDIYISISHKGEHLRNPVIYHINYYYEISEVEVVFPLAITQSDEALFNDKFENVLNNHKIDVKLSEPQNQKIKYCWYCLNINIS